MNPVAFVGPVPVSDFSDSPKDSTSEPAPRKRRAAKVDRAANSPAETWNAETWNAETWNYETTVLRVEQIIAQIESGELQLAEVFDQFAAAVDSLHQCEAFLSQRQKQVELVIETLTDEPEF